MLPGIRQTFANNPPQAIPASLTPKPVSASSRTLDTAPQAGPLANHLSRVKDLTMHNLDAKLKATLPAGQYKTLQAILNDIQTGSPALTDQVKQFIKANENNPAVIEALLKTINTTSLIIKTVEQQTKGQMKSRALHSDLNASMNTFVKGPSQSKDTLPNKIANLTISPVLTAHPTSVQKPEVSALLLQHAEMADLKSGNEMLCDALWPVVGVREERPSVNEEAKHLSAYAPNIYQAAQTVHRAVQDTLSDANGQGSTLPSHLIELGNWVGGDRDGNPNINANVLKGVVVEYARTAFNCLEEAISCDSSHPPSPLYELASKAGQNKAFQSIAEKLSRTRTHVLNEQALPIQGDLYLNPQELVNDLSKIDTAALNASDQTAWDSELNLFNLTAQSVGFHGASTDIRQNSAMNEKTVGELLRRSAGPINYEFMGESEKIKLLNSILIGTAPFELNVNPLANEPDHSEFRREIEIIQSYKTIHDTFGPKALQNCITANTESASDMLEVMTLLKYAGLAENNALAMNVVPLIETVNDLENGPSILNSMLSNPWYRESLRETGNTQQIMVGYSDSNRLDGPLCSTWAVYNGTTKMVALAKEHGVDIHVFHGRGGTEARGSGDSYSEEIRATNPTSLRTGQRQTEQGEEVLVKFGTRETATGNLADQVGSILSMATQPDDALLAKYTPVMDSLARVARETYGQLYNDPDLPAFVKASTPIEFMGSSNAGSRPASRANSPDGSLNLSKLRAIPWVASWNQSGMGMPSFYGTGSAIQSYVQEGATPSEQETRKETLQTMYREWPFFKAFVDRTDTALSKADMHVAQSYAALAPKQAAHLFNNIRDEYTLTKTQLQVVRDKMPPLGSNPDVVEVVEIINPLTTAGRAAQAALMELHQDAGNTKKAELAPLITLSILANAAGHRLG